MEPKEKLAAQIIKTLERMADTVKKQISSTLERYTIISVDIYNRVQRILGRPEIQSFLFYFVYQKPWNFKFDSKFHGFLSFVYFYILYVVDSIFFVSAYTVSKRNAYLNPYDTKRTVQTRGSF